MFYVTLCNVYFISKVKSMKATVFHEHGGPDVLSYEDIDTPYVEPNQSLIKVKYVALNHLDLFVRGGVPGLKLEMPHILGSDISGEIVEVGSNVIDSLEVGQKIIVDPGISCGVCEFCIRGQESLCSSYGIIGEHYRGGYAEYLNVDERNIIPIPKTSGLDMAGAAAMPLTLMTVWRLLMTKAQVKAGDDVLIIGIGGGVALAGLQIAKAAGARVTVTSSSNEKLEKAYILGADIGINHNDTPEYHKEIYRLTNNRGVDIVLDSVGQATWARSLKSLRKGGKLVTCGATSRPNAETNVNLLFWKQLEILGSTMGSRDELRTALKLVWNDTIRPIVDRILPLSRAQEAHEILEKGAQMGKLVLKP
ncbi:MAG: alcohol dehydrogenase [Candidatus Thorarchaeota archaeon]|nr:MAG: alcohol dehydrogenase [Candidatus Thorarchaeota archaeon]